jgi:hypothetical protein
VITLTGPADGAGFTPASAPEFTWTDSDAPWIDPRGRSGKYCVQLSADSTFPRRGLVVLPSKRGTSEQAHIPDERTWSRIDDKLRVDLSAGSVTVYWRVIAQDQDRYLLTPSTTTRTIQLSE